MLAPKYFVLIVDGDCHRGRSLASQLTDARCYAARVCSGVDALRFVRENEPDAVVSEWRLEDITGLELLREIKELSFLTKVILASDQGDWQSLRRTLAGGGEDLLTRPFSLGYLLRTLERSLKSARRRYPRVSPSSLVLAGP